MGIGYHLLPGVYPPSEDTFLLVEATAAEARPGERVLEVCCGAGLAAMAARQAGCRVTASDISPRACRNARLNRLDAVRADLLPAFRGPFDLVACNPPYLPCGEDDRQSGAVDPSLDGGRDGLDVTRRLLARAPTVLAPAGRLLLVASSLQGLGQVERLLADGGWGFEAASRYRAFFEELRAYRCWRETRT